MLRLSLLLLAICTPVRAFAIGATWPLSDTPRFWILGEGLGHFAFDAFYFQTRENYDSFGLATTPAQEDRTHYTNARVHAGFGFAPKLSLFAQADVHALFESNTDATAGGSPHNANQGFGDAFVGFRWLIFRTNPTDRVYPTEWSPESVIGIFEGTWAFPMYDRADAAKPPLGDQSNDFTGMARLAWYTNEWLAFSGGAGFITQREHHFMDKGGKRADLSLLDPLTNSLTHIDVSIALPSAESHRAAASRQLLSAANARVHAKETKYADLCRKEGAYFVPFILETTGAMSKPALQMISRIADQSVATNPYNPVTAAQLTQRVAIALHNGNAQIIYQGLARSAQAFRPHAGR